MFLEDLAILADIVGDIVTLPVKVAHWSVELGNDITETVAQDIQNRIEGTSERSLLLQRVMGLMCSFSKAS